MANCLIPEARLRSSAIKGFSIVSLTAECDCYLFSVSTGLRAEVGAASECIVKNVGLDLADSQLCDFE